MKFFKIIYESCNENIGKFKSKEILLTRDCTHTQCREIWGAFKIVMAQYVGLGSATILNDTLA